MLWFTWPIQVVASFQSPQRSNERLVSLCSARPANVLAFLLAERVIWAIQTKKNRSRTGCSQKKRPGWTYFFWRNLRRAAICAAMTDSSDVARAMSMSLFAFLTASSAALRASAALASSKSLPRIAVSLNTVM